MNIYLMCINVNIQSFGAHQNEVYFYKSYFVPPWFTSLGTCIGRDQLNFFKMSTRYL